MHPSNNDWLAGGGELGELIRKHDWAATPLGPPGNWPQSLRSAVSILLPSRAQICLFWGNDLVALYNDAYRPALGVKHPWALGRPAREVWSEFWDDVLRPLLEGVLQTGDAFWGSDFPFALERHGFPEETYFDISYDPVRDETGGVGGVFCIVSETTGRVIGERRLRALRDVGRAGLEANDTGAVFRDCANVLEKYRSDIAFAILYEWNAADGTARASAMAGVSAGAACAPALIKGERAVWPLERARAGEVVILEGDALGSAGPLPGGTWSEAATRVMILPVAVAGREPFGFLVAGLSPRLPLDDRYRDFMRLVASTIASAVASVRAREEERRRSEALAELDRAKTIFFSNVSHEFRTPLTLLLGPLQDELARTDMPDEARVRLAMAHRNAMRLMKLVNALLDFSRIEAGRMRATFAPTDLATFTAELASNFRSACDKAGIGLVIRCDPMPKPAYVDADLWEKLVLNLVSNAFKFTFEGEIEVSLRAVGDRAVLRVRDTGIGIDFANQPRIFERFRRVEGARSRSHEGSGIGLALVQELVRMHGGEIRVESQPGRGSLFEVRIPLGAAHLPADQVSSGPERTASVHAQAFLDEALGWLRTDDARIAELPPAASRGTERVLVADDNVDMREYIARVLGEYWHVTAVPDGDAALHALLTASFDLVVTDVMMPRMDGFRLLQAIRAEESLRSMSVIVLSARAGEEARIEGREAGADDYLTKPFTARELVAQVRAHLAATQARRSIARERELLLASERAARIDLQRQWEDLQRTFEQAPNPIVVLRGLQYRIELANDAACRVWGKSPSQVHHRPLLDALPELRGQGFDALLDGVMRTGEPYNGRGVPARLERSGALETRYFDFVYSPLRGTNGRVDGILVVAHDVTDQLAKAPLSAQPAAIEE